MLEEAGEYGIRYGLAIPVHGPMGSFGVFILARGPGVAAACDAAGARAVVPIAFDVREYLLGRVVAKVRKVADALELRSPGLLGKREKEVLLWTLEGYPAKLVGSAWTDGEYGAPVPVGCAAETGLIDEVRGGGASIPERAAAWGPGQ